MLRSLRRQSIQGHRDTRARAPKQDNENDKEIYHLRIEGYDARIVIGNKKFTLESVNISRRAFQSPRPRPPCNRSLSTGAAAGLVAGFSFLLQYMKVAITATNRPTMIISNMLSPQWG